ncbi:RNA polymerase sigma factor [Leptospira idonii]|uniref:Sigma-70 family RNA polymerase sigma factor n=1 Tax=Leptospira idonii TaxID=1193500 RepID=A0A4R9LYV4_9LEPT|nr:sigma-70 family RNA polymerase sigma factor [Leptospira idonii]
MKRYQAMVLSQANKAFSSSEEAEDFTQEVFLKAYESLSTFRGEAQFSTWLFQIARNQISKHFKKKKLSTQTWDDSLPTQVPNVTPSFADQLAHEEEGHLLRHLISKLPIAYQKPILLHYFENRSLKEISEDMNIKINTIKSHISRGKDLIRKWWKHE